MKIPLSFFFFFFLILLDDTKIQNEDVYKKTCFVNRGLADPYVVLQPVFTEVFQ